MQDNIINIIKLRNMTELFANVISLNTKSIKYIKYYKYIYFYMNNLN